MQISPMPIVPWCIRRLFNCWWQQFSLPNVPTSESTSSARTCFASTRNRPTLPRLPIEELETAIKSTGFFRNKAKNIKACSAELVEKYNGQVPQDLDALVGLAGVGRKTANVVLGTAFGIPTGSRRRHSRRSAQPADGAHQEKDAVKVEQDLMQLIPKDEWIGFSHRMILHGRQVCSARKPDCEHCSLRKHVPQIGVTKEPEMLASQLTTTS